MTSIVVALDGSEGSKAAFDAVGNLGLKPAEVILLTVLPVPDESVGARQSEVPWRWPGQPERFTAGGTIAETRAQAMDRLRDEAVSRLDDAGDELRAAGFTVKAEVAFGNPAQEILSAARRHNASAVAVATHGRTGLRATVLGSVASELIRARAVTVIVAPFAER
jgi:nucleotide-binding universal stress UspA family protein